MIQFDGYYVLEPFPFLDKKEEHVVEYLVEAFLFQNDGYVNIINKWSKNKNRITFNKKDFISKDSLVKYGNEKDGGVYLHKHIGKPWEEKFYYDKISDEEFASRQTGKVLKFVPWEDNGK